MQLDAHDVPILGTELIAEYETKLREQGVPLDEWSSPGITAEEQEMAVEPIGLHLPTEARTWWAWHNGCPRYGLSKLVAPVGEKMLTISEAVEVYREYRDIVQNLVEPDVPALANPDDRWDPSWLPILGPQVPTVIDCRDSNGDATPVRSINLQYVEESKEIGSPSLGQMMRWWIGAIDGGAWCWDTEKREWLVDPYRLDRDFKLSGLA